MRLSERSRSYMLKFTERASVRIANPEDVIWFFGNYTL